jgi:hypothetical protein
VVRVKGQPGTTGEPAAAEAVSEAAE